MMDDLTATWVDDDLRAQDPHPQAKPGETISIGYVHRGKSGWEARWRPTIPRGHSEWSAKSGLKTEDEARGVVEAGVTRTGWKVVARG